MIFKMISSDCIAKMLDEEVVKFGGKTSFVVEIMQDTVNVSSRCCINFRQFCAVCRQTAWGVNTLCSDIMSVTTVLLVCGTFCSFT